MKNRVRRSEDLGRRRRSIRLSILLTTWLSALTPTFSDEALVWAAPAPPAAKIQAAPGPSEAADVEAVFAAMGGDSPLLIEAKSQLLSGDPGRAAVLVREHFRTRITPAIPLPAVTGDLLSRTMTEADDALRHSFSLAGYDPIRVGERFRWDMDPVSNEQWTIFLNRHYHWRALARAYSATRDEAFVRECVRQLDSWLESTPIAIGASLSDGTQRIPLRRPLTLNAGIRMAETWPETFFRLLPSPEFTPQAVMAMLRSILEHARFLAANPTQNNWLTMEMNGLFTIGTLFPEFREASAWRKQAFDTLTLELRGQVYPDGLQVELSPGYHNVALLNFLGPVRLARQNGLAIPRDYLSGLERMYDADLYLMTPGRGLPLFNDSWPMDVQGIMREAQTLFPYREDFRWVATGGTAGKPPARTSHGFADGGILVMRSGWDTAARYLAFDVGPFGEAHQHEDKLNFVAIAYGKDVIVEAGRHAYDRSRWYDYSISARAHNVASVDGLLQNRRASAHARPPGREPYRWASSDQYDYAAGMFGLDYEGWGATGLRIATHVRRILYLKRRWPSGADYWVLLDMFEPADLKPHHYEASFLVNSQGGSVDPVKDAFEADLGDGVRLKLAACSTTNVELALTRGQEQPFIKGWMMDGYFGTIHRPVFAIDARTVGVGMVAMVHVLYPYRAGVEPELQTVAFEDTAALARPEQKDLSLRVNFADRSSDLISFSSIRAKSSEPWTWPYQARITVRRIRGDGEQESFTFGESDLK